MRYIGLFIVVIACCFGFLYSAEAQISDQQFRSVSVDLVSNGYDFVTSSGQNILPAAVECTNGIHNQLARSSSVLEAEQICRSIQDRDTLFFNCRRVASTYRCDNSVNVNDIASQPEGNVPEEQERIMESSITFTAQQFRFDGRTFRGECATSDTTENIAVCRRNDGDEQRYYACVDSRDPRAAIRFNCSVDQGVLDGDINTISDVNLSQEDFDSVRNESFDRENLSRDTDTSFEMPTADEKPVVYESFTNFPGLGRIGNLCQLIEALWFLGFAVLFLGVIGSILYGGFLYTSAGVNAAQVNQAKGVIQNAFIGLGLGLSIVVILQTIDPNLIGGNCEIPTIDRNTQQSTE